MNTLIHKDTTSIYYNDKAIEKLKSEMMIERFRSKNVLYGNQQSTTSCFVIDSNCLIDSEIDFVNIQIINGYNNKIDNYVFSSLLNSEDNDFLGQTFCNPDRTLIEPTKLFNLDRFSVNVFLEKIKTLQCSSHSSINKTLKFVYSILDDLLFEKQFEKVNEIFNKIDLNNTDPLILVSILTITDSWKNSLKLKLRPDFYSKVEKIVFKTYNRRTAKELLYDLK